MEAEEEQAEAGGGRSPNPGAGHGRRREKQGAGQPAAHRDDGPAPGRGSLPAFPTPLGRERITEPDGGGIRGRTRRGPLDPSFGSQSEDGGWESGGVHGRGWGPCVCVCVEGGACGVCARLSRMLSLTMPNAFFTNRRMENLPDGRQAEWGKFWGPGCRSGCWPSLGQAAGLQLACSAEFAGVPFLGPREEKKREGERGKNTETEVDWDFTLESPRVSRLPLRTTPTCVKTLDPES